MPGINANNIELDYHSDGPADAPVLLLIMGLGLPRAGWPPPLIELLTAEGFRVITFDNRDVGKSRIMDDAKPRNFFVQALLHKLRLPVSAPYRLADMMRDTEALMDALDVSSAHVVGVSMGGMIAQLLAIHAPARVRSLTSIMSTTGRRGLPEARPEITRLILSGIGKNSDEQRLAHQRKVWKAIGSPAYPRSEQEIDDFLQRIFEGGMSATGISRQILAIMASPNRVPQLEKLNLPTLVIHGDADPLVPLECGHDTARVIPNAQMVVIPGMGHDLPEELFGDFARMIAAHARAAGMRR